MGVLAVGPSKAPPTQDPTTSLTPHPPPTHHPRHPWNPLVSPSSDIDVSICQQLMTSIPKQMVHRPATTGNQPNLDLASRCWIQGLTLCHPRILHAIVALVTRIASSVSYDLSNLKSTRGVFGGYHCDRLMFELMRDQHWCLYSIEICPHCVPLPDWVYHIQLKLPININQLNMWRLVWAHRAPNPIDWPSDPATYSLTNMDLTDQ